MKKNLLLASILATVTLSVGVTSFARQEGEQHGSKTMHHGSHYPHANYQNIGTGGTGMQDFGIFFGNHNPLSASGLRDAITANDYTSFVKAWNIHQAMMVVPTKEKFAEQVMKYTAHKAMEATLVSNDYEAFKKAMSAIESTGTGVKHKPVLTAEQFAHKVSMHKKHQAKEAALITNNYEAFKVAFASIVDASTGKQNKPEHVLPITQEFATMVSMKQKQQAIEATFKANDYPYFLVAWKANIPVVPTAEEFAKIVAKKDEIKQDRKDLKNDRKELKDMVKNKKKVKRIVKAKK